MFGCASIHLFVLRLRLKQCWKREVEDTGDIPSLGFSVYSNELILLKIRCFRNISIFFIVKNYFKTCIHQ